jgi:multicomponent Na+:H+ antiporter subunit C
MTPAPYIAAGVVLVALAVHALIAHREPLRAVLALNVMGGGVFLLLVGAAARLDVADPVPHALVLTGIVVAVATTGLAVALIRAAERATAGDGDPVPGDAEDRG